jgi:flagellar biosynthesis repressor protein FlbT
MALKLSLKPGEKLVLNGAVISNGDRRTTLLLQNKASVLREKDIMQPDGVTSPARHIYFPVMMMYLDGTVDSEWYNEFAIRMTEFMSAVRNPEILADCVQISRDVLAREYYRALVRCRKLIAYEDERLGNGAGSISADADADRNAA